MIISGKVGLEVCAFKNFKCLNENTILQNQNEVIHVFVIMYCNL